MFDSYRNKKDLSLTQEEPKYKSKKESSISHSSSKSKHKHIYAPCKFAYSKTYAIPNKDSRTCNFTDIGTYCTICGKIGERKMWHRPEFREQFDKEHPDALVFDVEGYSDKFVKI